MATNIPRSLPDLIAWANAHAPLWTNNQSMIGLSVPQALAFDSAVTALNDASAAAQAARLASRNATLTLQDAVSTVRASGGQLVNVIKAFAEATDNEAVYTLAGVSPDSPPGAVPAPVPPVQFAAAVNSDGSLTLKWKAVQPPGVFGVQYFVYRALNGAAAFSFAGSAGSQKSFIDATLPFGVDRVDYMIQPRRGNVIGEQSATFALRFGSVGGGSGGPAIVSAVESPRAGPVRIAA